MSGDAWHHLVGLCGTILWSAAPRQWPAPPLHCCRCCCCCRCSAVAVLPRKISEKKLWNDLAFCICTSLEPEATLANGRAGFEDPAKFSTSLTERFCWGEAPVQNTWQPPQLKQMHLLKLHSKGEAESTSLSEELSYSRHANDKG